MESFKILIIEDEPLIAQNIKEMLTEFGYSDISIVNDSTTAVRVYKEKNPSLVIMDINLENSSLDGIQIAEIFNEYNRKPFIYLTSFADDETRNRARKTRPAYYLVKPCNARQLMVAIDFALDNFDREQEASISQSFEKQTEPLNQIFPSDDDSFFVKKGSRYIRVKIKDVLWIQAFGSSVEIITRDSKIISFANLSSFSRQIPSTQLFRIQRSFIVNLRHIDSFNDKFVFVKNKDEQKEIPIGKTYKDEFLKNILQLKSD